MAAIISSCTGELEPILAANSNGWFWPEAGDGMPAQKASF
jgi:hypothetical protein